MSDYEIWTLFAFILGTILGSFANVIIYRLPRQESIVFPRSRCIQCQSLIPFFLNIPIFSWLFLRGCCKKCGSKISLRYPIVEFLMGLSFSALFYFYGWSFSTLEYFIFSFGLITASFIDLDCMILPDRFTLSGILIGLIGALINFDRSFEEAFWGFLVGGGFLFAVSYFYLLLRNEEGMGGGDIKLMAWIGSVCGVKSILFVTVTSSFIGLVFGTLYLLKSKKSLRTGIPFGPYLSFSALIYLLIF